jgi:hypothetical protein
VPGLSNVVHEGETGRQSNGLKIRDGFHRQAVSKPLDGATL